MAGPPLAGKGNVAVGSEASEVTQAEASNRQPVVEVASVPRPEEQRKVQERDSSNEETEGSAGATISRARQRTAVAPPPVPAPPVTANLAVNFEKATADYDFEATEPDWQQATIGLTLFDCASIGAFASSSRVRQSGSPERLAS